MAWAAIKAKLFVPVHSGAPVLRLGTIPSQMLLVVALAELLLLALGTGGAMVLFAAHGGTAAGLPFHLCTFRTL